MSEADSQPIAIQVLANFNDSQLFVLKHYNLEHINDDLMNIYRSLINSAKIATIKA